MGITFIGLTAPVALALVALIGYAFGRRQKRRTRNESLVDAKLLRANQLLDQVESISDRLRRSMAATHSNVSRCCEQIQEMNDRAQASAASAPQRQPLEEILGPTSRLSRDIAHAYDELRRHTRELSRLRSR